MKKSIVLISLILLLFCTSVFGQNDSSKSFSICDFKAAVFEKMTNEAMKLNLELKNDFKFYTNDDTNFAIVSVKPTKNMQDGFLRFAFIESTNQSHIANGFYKISTSPSKNKMLPTLDDKKFSVLSEKQNLTFTSTDGKIKVEQPTDTIVYIIRKPTKIKRSLERISINGRGFWIEKVWEVPL